ncbi:MAG: hypothetical protein AAFQ57_15820, partial [Cyanobacteria bacterium J06626_14]
SDFYFYFFAVCGLVKYRFVGRCRPHTTGFVLDYLEHRYIKEAYRDYRTKSVRNAQLSDVKISTRSGKCV